MKTKAIVSLMLLALFIAFACSKSEIDDSVQVNNNEVQIKADSSGKVGEFDGTSITVSIRSSAIDSISDYLLDEDVISSEIDVIYIDDQDPCDPDSYAYLTISTISSTSHEEVYFQLLKVVDLTVDPCEVEYYLSAYAGDGILGGAKCEGVGCSSCKKIRTWFAGPVVGCDCLTPETPNGYCNHTTGGGGWGTLVVAILGIIF